MCYIPGPISIPQLLRCHLQKTYILKKPPVRRLKNSKKKDSVLQVFLEKKKKKHKKEGLQEKRMKDKRV